MFKMGYKKINEENSVYFDFVDYDELSEVLMDMFGLDIELLSNDYIRNNVKNLEVLIIKNEFDEVIIDYLR